MPSENTLNSINAILQRLKKSSDAALSSDELSFLQSRLDSLIKNDLPKAEINSKIKEEEYAELSRWRSRRSSVLLDLEKLHADFYEWPEEEKNKEIEKKLLEIYKEVTPIVTQAQITQALDSSMEANSAVKDIQRQIEELKEMINKRRASK